MTQPVFVQRKGNKLILGNEVYRFAGPNIYWLGLDENVNGVDWPTPFRVTNVLDTAVMMGANALRSHTLAASVGHPRSLMPTLRQMNEEALEKVDFALDEIAKRGLRVIIPFVCNWSYYHGGISTFTMWRGIENAMEFYSHPDIIADFKWYIEQLLNRTNTINGMKYKDDPTILAWELGNELNHVPVEWVEQMCSYIKSIDSNHLISHGKQFQVDADKLRVAGLDIIDVHYYPASAEALQADAKMITEADKVYIAGEYDWSGVEAASFLEQAAHHPHVSGTCFWSLFGHHDEGGYVQHYDGFALHYPGTGFSDEHNSRVEALRHHAYIMRQQTPPQLMLREAPIILDASEGQITFRGVAGGALYTLEKSATGDEGTWLPWIEREPYQNGMWSDPLRVKGNTVYYRVRAISKDGVEGPYSESIESAAF